jgi:hypothetical protein
MKSLRELQQVNLPEEWKIWRPRQNHVTGEINEYHVNDTRHFGVTPFEDVIQWDRLAAHMGIFPDTFETFRLEL